MLPITGSISIFLDPEPVKQYHDLGFRVLCLSDDSSAIAGMQNAMMCSILLPPYDAMAALLDGDLTKFGAIYDEFLVTSYEANTLISIILAALYKGVHMILYVPRAEYNLGFIGNTLNYIAYTTGCYPGFGDTMQFGYDMKYNDSNLIRLFDAGLLNYQELLPGVDNYIVLDRICQKVCMDIGFCPETPDIAIRYVNKYIDSIKANNNVFLKKGFIPA